MDAIRTLLSKKLVDGLTVTSQKVAGMCKDCIFGKQTHHPFDEVVTPEMEVNECVHTDLWGLAQVQLTGGKVYMMLFTDGGAGHSEVYFLVNKLAETTLQVLKSYHKMSEKQTGKPLKHVRTDEGLEFDNKLWREYLAEHGIIHEMTSPYSSSGNTVAEHANRMVMDCVQTVLHDAGLPGTYWAEGAAMVVYLKDFVPTTHHPGKTPYKLWYGKKPDIAHLRPFGCTAYARVPEEVIRGKLNDQSIKCILLGYYSCDGYCFLDQSSGRIFCSHDIIFEEGIAHRTLETDSLSTGE
jgi:Integrase core domain